MMTYAMKFMMVLCYLDDINYNTTENYYERAKYATMIPIIMKVLRLLLFYFYMLVALCLNDYYKKEFLSLC